jgi:hypothetical protein
MYIQCMYKAYVCFMYSCISVIYSLYILFHLPAQVGVRPSLPVASSPASGMDRPGSHGVTNPSKVSKL